VAGVGLAGRRAVCGRAALPVGALGAAGRERAQFELLAKAREAGQKRASGPCDIVKSLAGHSMWIGAAQDMMVVGFASPAIRLAGGWNASYVLLSYVENALTRAVHKRRWKALADRGT